MVTQASFALIRMVSRWWLCIGRSTSSTQFDKYNSIYRIQLPKITPHVCRHTYCSNMAKSGMNPKVLQYLMGHSDISVTLNTYTHLKLDDAREEVEKLAKKQAEADAELKQLGMKVDATDRFRKSV